MNTISIFTDGSSRGNPGPGGYGAICAYPDGKGVIHVDELGGRDANTTNNRMELQALISALDHMGNYYSKPHDGDSLVFNLYIDSSYVLQGADKWLAGWKRNNWITSTKEPVKNSDLWQTLDGLLTTHYKNGIVFNWNLIKGHSGIPGNERCDEIATGFADASDDTASADMVKSLYKGKLDIYPLGDIFFKGPTQSNLGLMLSAKSANTKSSSSNKGKVAYSYISLVDGVLYVDKTWSECETRVKGKSGARFKKSISREDEDFIKKDFLKK